MNAIASQRLHHAYLFTGSRGIGKTSIARILAKALRCPNVKVADGVVRSCGTCSDCREIAAGNSVDVLEIDGASNNGVDAVREIRDATAFMPSSGTRKIYVIDEVHMLTTAAFNALLKTLEEPPPHVIFIFATTEAHKIPATILSRCQQFEFKKVSRAEILAHLQKILAAEKIEADEAAVKVIAQAADGSLRDALSLLDQVIALSGQGTKITAEVTRESVGWIESESVLALVEHILARRPKEALAALRQIDQSGYDLRILTRSLIEVLHGLILVKVGAESEESGAGSTAGNDSRMRAAADLRPLEELDLVFQTFHHSLETMGRSQQPRIYLEVLVIKCAVAEGLVRVSEVGAEIGAKRGAELGEARPAASVQPVRSSIQSPQGTESIPSRGTPPGGGGVVGNKTVPSAPKTWEGLVAHLNRSRPLVASLLAHAIPSAWPEPGSKTPLEIKFKPEDGFKAEQLKSRATEEALRTAAQEYLGYQVGLTVAIAAVTQNSGAQESLASKKLKEVESKEAQARETVATHPIIQEAKSLFGGTLGPVEVARESSVAGGHRA